jgi:hypothetical protein
MLLLNQFKAELQSNWEGLREISLYESVEWEHQPNTVTHRFMSGKYN